jgi:alpha-tubulin suppressor-like RCC1 family protein
MGTAHPVLAVYEAGAGPLPRWPARTTPLVAIGNSDASALKAFPIPSGPGDEYLSIVGDSSTLGADYDKSALGGDECAPDSSSNDVGFKIHLDAPRTLRFDTEGSSFDTVLSLHSEPPLTNTGGITTLDVPSTNESASSAYDAGPVNGLRLLLRGDTTGMTSDVTDTFGCGMDNGSTCGDAVYAITVAQRTTLRMQVSGTGYEPALLVTRADPAGASGRYASFALGESHTCALSGGNVYCWGADDVGQLGDGGGAADPDSSGPVQVTSVSAAVQIGTGSNHSCAVTESGAVYCWGAGSAGQLGDGGSSDRYAPVQVLGVGGVGVLADAVQVACGAAHCCALRRSGGGAVCWGDNSHGQLGEGSTTPSPTPVPVTSSDAFEQIAANDDHTCAIRASDKAVFCWGSGAYGKTGNASGVDDVVPHRVGSLVGASSVMAGQDHNCAVLANGHVSCWGRGGRLGYGDDIADYAVPVTVLGSDGTPLANVKGGFAAGRAHSCVTLLSGLVQCWGDNASGQLGNASTAPALLATPTYDILDAVQVVASADHSCALRAEGSLLCWGDGAHSKLGNGAIAPALLPVAAQPGVPHVSFGTHTLDVGFSSACGALAQPPEPGCQRVESFGQSYFVCRGQPRTFAGAAQSCAAVGYRLVQVYVAGEHAFLASQLTSQSWIGAKRESSADWLSVSAGLHFDNLTGSRIWFTESAGYDDCSPTCTWVPPRGFFTASTAPDLVDSEPWSPFSTWGTDDEPSSQLGRNCVTLDPFDKWATNPCAVSEPTAPWLTDPAELVAGSLAGPLAAPDFAGGVEHDYVCEHRSDSTDVTLDPGKYFVTVKGSDGGVVGHECMGPYKLQIDDLATPTGGYITCDDNGVAGSTASVIERTLPAGDYFLVLKGKQPSDAGPYQLTVRDVDAVHTTELACDAGGGLGDPAKLRMTAQPGKTYYALVKGQAAADKGAYTLDVRDVSPAVGALVQCDADSGAGSSSALSLDLATGSYYAVLTGRATDSAGTYRLTLGGAAPVSSTFVPPSYADTVAALTQHHIRVGTVLSCDTSSASCAEARAQATELAADTGGAFRVAATADDVPAQVVQTVQILEALDTLRAQLLFTPDSDPGFVSAGVTAIPDVTAQCTLGSDGMSFVNCRAGASASFSVSLTNPALPPVPPSTGPLGAYQFTLRITGQRDGDTVFSEDVPVLAAPTGAAPPMTYTSGSYHQDFDSRGCRGNTRPSWDRLTVDADVRPDTSLRFDACTADNLPDLAECDAGAPSSGYKRVLTITAGTGNGTPCTVATQAIDCPEGYCSPYTSICNYLEGVTCTQDTDCPGTTLGRCRAGPSVATLGYTCDVVGMAANPAGVLRVDNFRVDMRLRADLESLGDGSRTPSLFFWEAQYNCQAVE